MFTLFITGLSMKPLVMTLILVGVVAILSVARPVGAASFMAISAPLTSTKVSDGVHVVYSGSDDVAWVNIYLDGHFAKSASGNFGNYLFDSTLVGDGNHTVKVVGHNYPGNTVVGDSSITIDVENVASNIVDPQTTSCTAANMADNPTISDTAAANLVNVTQQSKVENNAFGTANVNTAANDYCGNGNCSTQAYANQLAGFHAPWRSSPIMSRVDGHCEALGAHPTTAQIMQWAAFKWGFSPTVVYAEGTNDGKWDMASAGDCDSTGHNCCSVGIGQIAYCNNDKHPQHAIQGLNTGSAGHLLPKENTCFNLDLFTAFIYRNYHSATCAQGNLRLALAQWLSPSLCSTVHYSDTMCNSIATHDWQHRFFSDQTVPY